MAKWTDEAIRKTDEKTEGAGHYNLFLFRVEEFKKHIERTGNFARTCEDCRNNKACIDEILLKIDEAVKVPGNSRREYDRLFSHLSGHMRKAHRIYPPHYFRNMYSFFGMVTGPLVGLLLFKLIPFLNWEMFAAGLIAGAGAGYLTGIFKDNKVGQTK